MTIKRDIKYWFQRRTRGWSDDETWNLDYEFIKWINTRFKKYRELANEVVDLSFPRFKYKKKVYTKLELIDKVILLSDELIEKFRLYDVNDDLNKKLDELLGMFKLIIWHMGW